MQFYVLKLFVCYTAVSYLSLTNSGDVFFLCFVLSWKNEIVSAKIPARGKSLGQIPHPMCILGGDVKCAIVWPCNLAVSAK